MLTYSGVITVSVNQATSFSAARISLPSRWHRHRPWGLTGRQAPILNIISRCVFERVSRLDEHWISGLNETDFPLCVGGHLPIHPGSTWVEKKVEEGGKNVFFYFPASLQLLISPALAWLPWPLSIKTILPQRRCWEQSFQKREEAILFQRQADGKASKMFRTANRWHLLSFPTLVPQTEITGGNFPEVLELYSGVASRQGLWEPLT